MFCSTCQKQSKDSEGRSGRKRKRSHSRVQITTGKQPVSIRKEDNLDEETFNICKEIIRPVRRALNHLQKPRKGLSLQEEVERTRISLLKIGDHISEHLKVYSDQEEIRLWRT
nr:chromodomain-helicase-DNA-binding protein 2-like [Pogona vitticeps]